MANRQPFHVWVETYTAEGAVVKNGFVIRGTAAHQAKVPTAAGEKTLGLALDDAADTEEFPVLIVGRDYVLDKAGNLVNGDYVMTSATAEFEKASALTGSGAYGAGIVDGDDAAAADDLVLIRVGIDGGGTPLP